MTSTTAHPTTAHPTTDDPTTGTGAGPSCADLVALADRLAGELLLPGMPGYDQASRPWNLSVQQHPRLVVRPVCAHDVQQAVRFAADHRLGVAMMSTGHGVTVPCDGGLLLDTSRMRGVEVDADRRTARVAAGARWTDLVPAAARYGLTGLPGSSPGVGVVGYTLGGGFGWLGRRFGLSCHDIVGADLVTAAGELIRVEEERHPDLLWGLRGGTGNFGVVTALELRLHPVTEVIGGNLIYPLQRLTDVATAFADWTGRAGDELTAGLTIRWFPPLPQVPEPLRGKRFAVVRGAWCGPAADGMATVDALRRRLGPPLLDTVGPLPIDRLGEISMDPVEPLPVAGHADLLPGLPAALIDELVASEGPDSPLVMVEIRTLGGALAGRPDQLSPMAHTAAAYSLNAIGLTTGDRAAPVHAHLARLRRRLRPYATGEAYLNFLDAGTATPARVRRAFTDRDWHRLLALKQRYDPTGLFAFNRNVPTPGR